ncbi:MAG: hypothetical protein Q4C67_08555 [Deinococcus sp.]|nr:hypothetical protein [Deinococcus sp.]
MTTTPISDWYMQGDNLHTLVFDSTGKVAPDLVWAIANGVGRTAYTVQDYSAQGYQVVKPGEVETLPGGTFRPEKAKYGVMFEFDKKEADVRNVKGMVLMFKPESVKARELADMQTTRARLQRSVTKTEGQLDQNREVKVGVTTDMQDEGVQPLT